MRDTWICFGAAVAVCGNCWAMGPTWTTVLRSADFIAGSDLQNLNVRHTWAWKFNGGQFEVAVKKTAIPIPAPQCRMDYLILRMSMYYRENPVQATTGTPSSLQHPPQQQARAA